MIRRFLQHIREQPRSVRDSYALSGAICGTVVVALLWLVQGPVMFQSATPEPAAVADTEQSASGVPFGGFARQFQRYVGSWWTSIQETIATPEAAPEASAETAPDATAKQAPERTPSPAPEQSTGETRTVLIATSSASTATTTDGE